MVIRKVSFKIFLIIIIDLSLLLIATSHFTLSTLKKVQLSSLYSTFKIILRRTFSPNFESFKDRVSTFLLAYKKSTR